MQRTGPLTDLMNDDRMISIAQCDNRISIIDPEIIAHARKRGADAGHKA